MLSSIKPEQHANARPGVLDILGHVERGKLWLLPRMVFERFPVESETFALLACFGGRGRLRYIFFVEAAARFVAQPFAIEHLLEKIRKCVGLALSPTILDPCHVADYMPQNIQPNQIDGPKRRRLRPADRLPGKRVYLLNAQVHLLHQAHGVHYRKCTNTIGDEIWRVFGNDNAFAQPHVSEPRDRVEQRAVSFRCRNNLQQPHISRWIEKMRAKPRPLEIIGKSFRNLCNGQAARVRGDDRARLTHSLYFLQQSTLDLKVLDHGFNDPIHLGDLLKIVFKISDCYQSRKRWLEKRRRLRLLCSLKPSSSDFVPRRTIRVGRNDIEQVAWHASISEMRRDTGTHGPGAKNCNFIYALHEKPF